MTEFNQTIYKKDTKGNIRFLEIYTKEGYLFQKSGIMNTDNPIIHSKLCKSKNVGKSNETSAADQAQKQGEALLKTNLTKGYFLTYKEANTKEVLLPMLAKYFKKESHKIDFKMQVIYAQPKLDGMRCFAKIISKDEIELMSREGKPIGGLDHIREDLKVLAENMGESLLPFIFDGEIYSHDFDFQENMEATKSYKAGLTEQVKFHMYDIAKQNTPFAARKDALTYYSKIAKGLNIESLQFVESNRVFSLDDIKNVHQVYLRLGYEGTMIRISNSEYRFNGRSSSLLKYKDFQDIALPLLDVKPCDNRPEWGEPIYFWQGADHKRHGKNVLGSGTKMTHAQKKDLLLNKEKYIGKTAEVRFFEYSNKGVPRFPVTVGFRLDK